MHASINHTTCAAMMRGLCCCRVVAWRADTASFRSAPGPRRPAQSSHTNIGCSAEGRGVPISTR